jgi:putative transposase
MSRLRRIEVGGRYFFITTNLAKHLPALSPAERDICLGELARVRRRRKFSIFAYVVMPNHAHLLLWMVESSLPGLMRDWKSASGFAIAKARGRKGAIWQPRYFDFILRRSSDFGKKFEYIHDNPVVAGLVSHAEDWPWSSAGFYMKKTAVAFQLDIFDIPPDPNEPLWPVSWR